MRWKIRSAKRCQFSESTRAVYVAMLMLSDWKGRLKAPIHEIAEIAGVSPRQVYRELPSLYASGEVLCSHRGHGRTASYYYLKMTSRSGDLTKDNYKVVVEHESDNTIR